MDPKAISAPQVCYESVGAIGRIRVLSTNLCQVEIHAVAAMLAHVSSPIGAVIPSGASTPSQSTDDVRSFETLRVLRPLDLPRTNHETHN